MSKEKIEELFWFVDKIYVIPWYISVFLLPTALWYGLSNL